MPLHAQVLQSDSLRLLAYCTLGGSWLWAAHRSAGLQARVCSVMAGAAFALGFALWFDVAGDVANLGRRAAGSEGWYGGRRPVQAAFILAILGLTLALSACVWRLAGSRTPRLRVPLLLFLALLGYVVIRTISLHQVDAYLNRTVARSDVHEGDAVELAWVLTVAGTVVVSAARQGNKSDP